MPKAASSPMLATTSLTKPPAPDADGRRILSDGIYIGLPADAYHADDALGSSNIRDLLKGGNLYWHKSGLNPKRPKEKPTPSKILGTATHMLLLEGRKAFDAVYVRGPYGEDDDHLSGPEKGQLTKKAKEKLLDGQELLTQADYDFVLGCKDVLDADPELKGCLDNGLSEVSVFWTRKDGVRCKARFDKLKQRGIGDIKTIANERERPLEQACLLDIHTYRYDIPAEHYSEGRRQMRALLTKGSVFVQGDDGPSLLTAEDKGADEVLSFLARCVAEKTFGFQIVFIPKKGAPDAWSCVLSPGNEILLAARTDIDTAISYYRMAMDKYGRERRWLPEHAVEELTIDKLPYGFGRITPRGR